MEFGPFADEAERPGRDVAAQDVERLDDHRRLVLAVDRVEVRWDVIAVVHRDDDAVEHADTRHGPMIHRALDGSVAARLSRSGAQLHRHDVVVLRRDFGRWPTGTIAATAIEPSAPYSPATPNSVDSTGSFQPGEHG